MHRAKANCITIRLNALILMETIDQLDMANRAHWHGYVVRRALKFEMERQ